MGTLKDIATPLVARGIPITPVRPRSKAAFLQGWQQSATSDMDVITQWDSRFPDHNAACVAKAELGGFWFLELDSPEARARIESETGQTIPDTFRVRSRPGRGHFYWKQTPASIAMGNISQSFVKGEDWSARVNNEYVVAPGSIHKDTGLPYQALDDSPIVEAPDWLVQWLISQKVSTNQPQGAPIQRNEQDLVPHGSIHGYMLREAGKLRNMGLDEDEIYPALSALVHKNCAPPIDESKVKQMAHSICNFAPGQPTNLIMTQQAVAEATTVQPLPPELDTREEATRPVFPQWVMRGTALWNCLVEPAMESSSKYPEFIFMPAFQIFLNYLTGKVFLGDSKAVLNMYLGLISPYGQFFKSSSCEVAQAFFNYMGLSQEIGRDTKAAEGKVLITNAGSPEGFGVLMQKVNAKNAIMYNDELGEFVAKSGIESSNFGNSILKWYDAANFSNTTLNSKNKFYFESKQYCFGWCWCTTDRGFNRHWPRIAEQSSGLVDRMFFVVSPAEPRPTTPYRDPNFSAKAHEMKRIIDNAVQKQRFEYEDFGGFADRVKGMDPRSMTMVERLALGFAILLGYDKVEDDSIERALALVEYRNQSARFLEPIEADNMQGRLQKEISRELRQHRGKMRYRDLYHNLDGTRYGKDVWNRAFKTMLPNGNDEGEIVEFWEETTPGKRPTRMVGLLKHDD